MRVLVTGAFGNIGSSLLDELTSRGHTVRCFDVGAKANRRRARAYAGKAELLWGDVRRLEDLETAVAGQDAVVHLAFVIPHLSITGVESERQPEWARQVNVEGTRNLIAAMEAQPQPPRLIFASSLHIYGRTQDQKPPRLVTDPLRPTEHYSRHKVECEGLVRSSSLRWAILRLAATFPLAIKADKGMFNVPLSNRMEFIHTRDVALAMANALESEEVWGETLHIGGGPRCQFYFRDLAGKVLETLGVGRLPEAAYATVPFATDWLDTGASQALLHYQTRTLDDYAREMARLAGVRRHLIRTFRPFVRYWLLSQSPYYPRLRLWPFRRLAATSAWL
ncbi:MAG: NAD-dependent epimerase/dehydratase family protein [Anaerolineae bacterium]